MKMQVFDVKNSSLVDSFSSEFLQQLSRKQEHFFSIVKNINNTVSLDDSSICKSFCVCKLPLIRKESLENFTQQICLLLVIHPWVLFTNKDNF